MADDQDSEPTWTFVRGTDRIVLRCPSRTQIVISGTTPTVRRIDFAEPRERVAYQSGFESHLIRSGWSLANFTGHRAAPPRKGRLLTRIPFAGRVIARFKRDDGS